jgi:hypothetical protein
MNNPLSPHCALLRQIIIKALEGGDSAGCITARVFVG